MMEMMVQSQRDLADIRRSPSVPVYAPKEPEANAPDVFNGKHPEKLNQFLFQCEQVFLIQASRFHSDELKVRYMISFLRDGALDAVRPLSTGNKDSEELATHDSFVKFLKASFGDPDEKGTTRRKFKELVQTGTAADYFAKVREYVAILEWPHNGPVVDRVLEGLSSELKDDLAHVNQDFESIEELQKFVIPLDNRLRARQAEKKKELATKEANNRAKFNLGYPSQQDHWFPSQNQVPQSQIPNQTRQVPAQSVLPPDVKPKIPASTQDSANSPSSQQYTPRGPRVVSDAEKERRYTTGDCLYCGDHGHRVRDCPQAAKSPFPRQFTPQAPAQVTSSTPSQAKE